MDKPQENIRKTTLVLKSPSSNGGSEKPKTKEQTELENIRSDSLTALKIVTIASISGDDISESFFSNYLNYSTIAARLKTNRVADDTLIVTEEEFLKNPIDYWMKIVLVLFTTLYAFPDHGDIECDVITSTSQNAANGEKSFAGVGSYFSTLLRLESLDWSRHKVDLFVPSERGGRMIFIIDDEPSMYSIV